MKMGDDNQNLLMALQFLINTIWREGTNNGARKEDKPISLKRAFAIPLSRMLLQKDIQGLTAMGKRTKIWKV
jgi:hypothetical protein